MKWKASSTKGESFAFYLYLGRFVDGVAHKNQPEVGISGHGITLPLRNTFAWTVPLSLFLSDLLFLSLSLSLSLSSPSPLCVLTSRESFEKFLTTLVSYHQHLTQRTQQPLFCLFTSFLSSDEFQWQVFKRDRWREKKPRLSMGIWLQTMNYWWSMGPRKIKTQPVVIELSFFSLLPFCVHTSLGEKLPRFLPLAYFSFFSSFESACFLFFFFCLWRNFIGFSKNRRFCR